MNEPTFPRKVYICSRQAAATSRSTSDFDLTLSRNIVLPQKCAGFITDIQIPHSWYTVDDGQRFLYFHVDVPGQFQHFDKIELSKGNYTGADLATAIRTKVNDALNNLALTGLQFFCKYETGLHVLHYSLSPPYNYAQLWTDSRGDTYTVSASTSEPDQWEIDPQVVDHYDLSVPAWTFVNANHRLTKVNSTTYEGEYYFLQGEWQLLNSNPPQNFVVSAEPAFSGSFLDDAGATIEVTGSTDTELTLRRMKAAWSGPATGTLIKGTNKITWHYGDEWELTTVTVPNQLRMLDGSVWTTNSVPSKFTMRRVYNISGTPPTGGYYKMQPAWGPGGTGTGGAVYDLAAISFIGPDYYMFSILDSTTHQSQDFGYVYWDQKVVHWTSLGLSAECIENAPPKPIVGAQPFTATVTDLTRVATTASYRTGTHTGIFHPDTGLLAWDTGTAWDAGGSILKVLRNGAKLYADQVGPALKLTGTTQSAVYDASAGRLVWDGSLGTWLPTTTAGIEPAVHTEAKIELLTDARLSPA